MKNLAVLWKFKSENPNAPLAKGVLNWQGKQYRIVMWKKKKEKESDPDVVIQLDNKEQGYDEKEKQEEFVDDTPF